MNSQETMDKDFIFTGFMKKILATITLIMYFAVSCGIMVNYHYCMDNYDSVNFYTVQNDECNKCGMHTSQSNGCCHDDVKIIKIQDNHNAAGFVFTLAKLAPIIIEVSSFTAIDFNTTISRNQFLFHSPPLINKQETYLQNSVFLI